MRSNHQKPILAAMTAPGFYPHRVDTVTRRETHISTVFMTGSYVYKVKKPVNLGFLDFTTLEKRTYYCRQEIVLNRRLTSGIYLEALPITAQKGGYALDGAGETVETVVKMRQLNEMDAMLPLLQRCEFTDLRMGELIDRLVAFYTRSPACDEPKATDVPAWEGNLQLMEPFVGRIIDKRRFSFVRTASEAFFSRCRRLFRRRIEKGRIRDGHGDLRCDHIYFTPEGIQIIDCIEFNDDLRVLDTISDLAFLSMDLEFNGFVDPARTLIHGYVTRTDDVDALPLLDFYRCYRAMVRCKVSCFLLRDIGLPEARRRSLQAAANAYLTLAHKYAAAFNWPTIWVVSGLPASGKSTLAKALAGVLDLEVIRSDEVRKRLFAHLSTPAGNDTHGSDLYSAYATEVTYNNLLGLAREILKKGRGVIVDATFSRDMHRRGILRTAEICQALTVFVECRAGDALLVERLRKRETEPSLSDARLIHLERFRLRYAPMTGIEPAVHIRVNTEQPIAACLQHILLNKALWVSSADLANQRIGGKNV